MSSYHSSFKFLNQKSDEDFGWIITHFDPDNGETDSYLSREQVYSDSYNGSKRTLYGTRWNAVATPKITVIKQDGSDFSLQECREAYRWLTGNPEASWMDLYIGDEVRYRLLCTIQDVKPQKMDARTVGLNIYCESLSPWAYSPLVRNPLKEDEDVIETTSLGTSISFETQKFDDKYNYVYLKTTYTNKAGDTLTIYNNTTQEETKVTGLKNNEKIVLDSNMMITSDSPGKVFGNSFNFVWPRLIYHEEGNELVVIGDGEIIFEYYYPIKMGDCATDINIVSDPICNSDNQIQVDKLPFNRISDLPTTLREHNIQDAYTKTEVDNKISNMLTDNFYTKTEVDALIASITIDSDELNAMLDEVLI